jgi:superoxide dismutase, Fe-Mn family
MAYTAKKFQIPELRGISAKTIEEHMKLYQGYVKHANLIQEKIAELQQDSEKNAYPLAEVQRRLGFEYGGMKNHEAYFAQFEGGSVALGDGALKNALETCYGSVDAFLAQFKATAMTRGIGWAMLYQDIDTHELVTSWVDEQHLGQLATARIILALDMWEHSYMLDVPPSEKKTYVEAFFQNLNWQVCAARMM